MRRVLLIEAAKAAAFGTGLDIMSPHGVMVVDLGAGTIDAAVMSLGGVSVSKTLKQAGNAMDDEIIKYIRKKHNLVIGKAMAKSCKEAIACVIPFPEERRFRVKGRDALRGLPRALEVTSEEIMSAVKDIARNIIDTIVDTLEDTPPELLADIHSDGITLTGGLSKLYGMKELLEKQTGIKIHVAKDPQDSVVKGCFRATKYIEEAEAQKSSLNPLMTVY